jgi:Carboxypeptidase regulatory-like domain
MNTKLLLGLILAGLSASPGYCVDPIIQGSVLEMDKKTPISNASVEIYSSTSGGKAILVDKTKTDQSGYYKFDKLKASDSYDIVYSHSKYEDDVVTRLAENAQQQIRKYLYQKGQKPATIADLQQRLFSTKRMAMLAITTDEPGDTLKEFINSAKYNALSRPEYEKELDSQLQELTINLSSTKAKALNSLVKSEFAGVRAYLNAVSN